MGQDDVSNVVLSIIAAFASCRDVLRKVKQRRRKTPQRQHDQDHANESRLEHSLLLGPQEIDQCYRAGLSKLGHAFDRGDTPARTELTSVLLRLNAGLVDIIARFVSSPDPGKLHLDYAVLTQLSDTSRVQARRSLVALSRRLTKAVLTPGPDTWKAKQRDPANTDVNAAITDHPRRHGRHKAIPNGECISISKQNHETQIALIRPRNKRTLSSESATSNKTKEGKSKTRTEHRPKSSKHSTPSDGPGGSAATYRARAVEDGLLTRKTAVRKQYQRSNSPRSPRERDTAQRSSWHLMLVQHTSHLRHLQAVSMYTTLLHLHRHHYLDDAQTHKQTHAVPWQAIARN